MLFKRKKALAPLGPGCRGTSTPRHKQQTRVPAPPTEPASLTKGSSPLYEVPPNHTCCLHGTNTAAAAAKPTHVLLIIRIYRHATNQKGAAPAKLKHLHVPLDRGLLSPVRSSREEPRQLRIKKEWLFFSPRRGHGFLHLQRSVCIWRAVVAALAGQGYGTRVLQCRWAGMSHPDAHTASLA